MGKSLIKKVKSDGKTWLIYMALLGMALNIVATPLGINKLMQLGAYLSLGAAILCLFYSIIFEEANIQGILMLGFLCITIGSLMITGSVTYKNVVRLATFLELPILMFSFDKETRNSLLPKIFFLFLCLTAFYFLLSFKASSYIEYKYYDKDPYKYPDWKILTNYVLAMGYENPNQAGLQLIQCAFIMLCAISYYKDIRVRAIFAAAIVVCAYLIYKTESRTCLLVLAFGIGVFAFQKFIKIKPILVLLVMLVPIAVVLFLLYGEFIYSKLPILGEAFDTGRKNIFLRPFKNLSFITFLFGDSGKHDFENYHNAYLTVFANVGIIGFAVFFGLIMHKILRVVMRKPNAYQRTAVIGMLVLILHSCMEAATFTTGAYLSTPFFLLYLISCTNERKKLKKPKNFTNDYFR